MRVVAVVGQGRALEVALGLGDTVALALAPPEAEEPLRAARAAGAPRAVAVWDDALRDTDYYGAAQVLAAAAQKLGADVVVCGDFTCGLLAPALADRMGVPHVSGVVSAEVRGGAVVAARPSAGRLYLLSAEPPLVLGVAGAAVSSPATEAFEVERLTLAALGIAPAELRWRRRFLSTAPGKSSAPAPVARALRLPDPRSLVERLRAEGLLPARRHEPAASSGPGGPGGPGARGEPGGAS